MNTLATDDRYSRQNVQEFPATTSKGIISKTKDFSCNFYFFSQIYINFRIFFFKKDESPSLSISQIIDSEKGGYLNV